MAKELQTIDKLRLHIFDSKSMAEVYLSADEMEVKKRVEAIFAILIEEPTKPHKEIRNFLKTQFDISTATAYRDISIATALWGNFKKASKEYNRHKLLAMVDESYEMAKSIKDAKAMVAATDKFGKYTRLDQDDIDQIDWNELLPPPFEPTNDVSIIGLPRIDEAKRQALRKKYIKDATIAVNSSGESVYIEDNE